MALNINWRFAGPQDIKVPQSNFLNSLDKNIQKGLEIKKEFDKKRYDNEMIRLMTEDAEKKLEDAIKTNDIEKIKAAEKELADARMSANQFKTTGTTDFFRWKKDKEYASEVANINRDILDQQTKEEKLSNLYWDIRRKEAELETARKTYDIDKENEIIDELNILYGRYNEASGKEFYKPLEKKQKKTPEGEGGDNGQNNIPKGKGAPRRVESIEKSIEDLKWEENLDSSGTVNDLRTEIGEYKFNEGKKLAEKLDDKLEEVKLEHVNTLINDLTLPESSNSEKFDTIRAEIAKLKVENNRNNSNTKLNDKNKKLEAEQKRKKNKSAEDREVEEKNLKSMRNKGEAQNLLNYYHEEKNLEDHRNSAKKYLIQVLGDTPYDKDDPRRDTPAQAAYTKYKDNDVMRRFIKDNKDAINAIQPVKN